MVKMQGTTSHLMAFSSEVDQEFRLLLSQISQPGSNPLFSQTITKKNLHEIN